MKKWTDKKWTPEILTGLVQWLEDAYPSEGCGLILENEQGRWRFHECENVADRYHKVDPVTFPRTSREFYMIDPREFMRAEDRGEKVAVIVHSHPDVGDYFSPEDIAAALMPRSSEEEKLEPIYPGTDYLVVSVRKAKADGASLFRFDDDNEKFVRVARLNEEELFGKVNGKEAQVETVA